MNLFKFAFSRKNKKVALVLSSGAAGGMAHVGVIKAIEEEGIAIDAIAGSSMGALVGACYASKRSVKELEEIMLKTDWRRLLALADFNLAFMLKGFVRGEKVKELLKAIIGDSDFDDLKLPFAVTATDIETGKGVVINRGSVLDAVRASISIPVIFTPVNLGGRYFCDGGVVNPVPVSLIKDFSSEAVLVSDTTHNPEKRIKAKKKEKAAPANDPPRSDEDMAYDEKSLGSFNSKADTLIRESVKEQNESKKFLEGIHATLSGWSGQGDPEMPDIFTVMLQSLYSMEHKIASSQVKGLKTVITSDISHIETLEFYRGQEAISRGYEAAKKLFSKRSFIKLLR
jgi:NTE family protein